VTAINQTAMPASPIVEEPDVLDEDEADASPAGHRWWAVRSGSWRIRRGARADDDDESTGARDRRVEQVSLQHRRMLDQEREHHRRILEALGPMRFSATVIWIKRFSSRAACVTDLMP